MLKSTLFKFKAPPPIRSPSSDNMSSDDDVNDGFMGLSPTSSTRHLPGEIADLSNCVSVYELQQSYVAGGVVNPKPSGVLTRADGFPARKLFTTPARSAPGAAPLPSWPCKSEYPAPSQLRISERSRRKFAFININDVIDLDVAQHGDDHVREVLIGGLLESTPFKVVILLAITINSIAIGLQTVKTLSSRYLPVFQAMDSVFLTIFTVEIFLKWMYGFRTFWKVGWNVFDFLLVVISLLGSGMAFLSTGRLLRVFRILRAFRSLRSVSAFKGMQMVVSSLIRSLPDLINVLGLLLIVMFVFAVIGIDMFSSVPNDYFSSISKAMFTLFVFMSQDGWASIYADLRDMGYGVSIGVYAVVFITIGGFVFTQIIAGLTVTNLLAAHNELKAIRRIDHRKLIDDGNNNDAGADDIRKGAAKNDDDQYDEPPPERVPSAADRSDIWMHQTPTTFPNYDVIKARDIENYCLVLIAIEENLQERQKLRGDIEKILKKVKALNVNLSDEIDEALYESDDEEIFAGDALTKIIMAEKQLKERNARFMQSSDRVRQPAPVSNESMS